MSMAAVNYPALLRKYNDEGAERAETARREATQKRAPSEAEQRWDRLVASIMDRDKVSRAVAMQRARRQSPVAFRAYQAG